MCLCSIEDDVVKFAIQLLNRSYNLYLVKMFPYLVLTATYRNLLQHGSLLP